MALCFAVTSFAQKGKLTTAKRAFGSGDYALAYSSINSAASHEKTKDNPETWLYKSKILSLLEISPTVSQLIGIEVKEGESEEALDMAIALDTDGAFKEDIAATATEIITNTNNQGATAYNDDKNYALTSEIFRKKIALKEKYQPDAEADPLDFLYQGTDQGEKYLKALKRTQEIYPDDNNYKLMEIDYLIAEGKIDEVLDQMLSASEKEPDNTNLMTTIASVYKNKGDIVTERQWLKKALTIDADHFESNFNLGVSFFNEAVQSNDIMNFEGSTTSATYIAEKKKRDTLASQAIPLFEKAYASNPTDQAVLLALVQYHRLKDDKVNMEKFQSELDATGY